MELWIARKLGYRENLIVINVSWGMGLHECDLLCMSKSGYLTEIEIKISLSDLKKDINKRHGHTSPMIKCLYFAIPFYMESNINLIPDRAGIFVVDEGGFVKKIRKPLINKKALPLSEDKKFQLARLGAMRVWGLKSKIIDMEVL